MNAELKKTELLPEELRVLISYYDDALDEMRDAKSPILKAHRESCLCRREELEKQTDGRYWNRGKGRKPKDKPAESPPLPMENNPVDKPQAPDGVFPPNAFVRQES
jgi:hypothetical protein